MGYCVSMDCDVKILKQNEKKTISILKRLAKNNTLRWVNGNFEDMSIKDIFEDLRYNLNDEDPDYFVIDYFSGEKLGSDDEIWEALAPVVESGSSIECSGEDDAKWIWVFKQGKMTTSNGEVVYKDHEPGQSPYEILEIPPSSTKEEIVAAFNNKTKGYDLTKVTGLAPELYIFAERKIKDLISAKEEAIKRIVAKMIHS